MERDNINRMALGGAVLGGVVLGGCADLAVGDAQSLLLPTFTRSEIVGFVAGFGTTFAAAPDLVKMLRRRSSQGINPTMASIMCIFQILWIYYGFLIASRPVIVWNIVAVIVNLTTVIAYRAFRSNERNQLKP